VAAADAVVTAAAGVVATTIAPNENHAGNFVGRHPVAVPRHSSISI